ncbi:NAD(P)-binding protein [Streptomyces sp. BE230]|uniref:NAD(P)-binding protein n=1 Tax=Streptomyces sp. BE230 TaxID=3002526 RepID=UPI003FA77C84
MRACVVGAGPGGIVAAKVLLENGFDITVLDKYQQVGGSGRQGAVTTGWPINPRSASSSSRTSPTVCTSPTRQTRNATWSTTPRPSAY